MIIRTKNSVYEVDIVDKRVRRLEGKVNPTPRQGPDGEWKHFKEVWQISVGSRMLIIWGPREDDPEVMKTTVTSVVTDVEELQ